MGETSDIFFTDQFRAFDSIFQIDSSIVKPSGLTVELFDSFFISAPFDKSRFGPKYFEPAFILSILLGFPRLRLGSLVLGFDFINNIAQTQDS